MILNSNLGNDITIDNVELYTSSGSGSYSLSVDLTKNDIVIVTDVGSITRTLTNVELLTSAVGKGNGGINETTYVYKCTGDTGKIKVAHSSGWNGVAFTVVRA